METHHHPRTRRTRLLRAARYLVYVLIAGFLLDSLLSSWGQVQQYDWQFSVWRFGLAFVLHSIYFVSHGLLWVWLVRSLNVALPYRAGLPIYMVSKLSKYIPGGVWPFASVAALGKQAGLSAARMTATLLMTTLLALWVSALYGLPVVPLLGQGTFDGFTPEIVIVLVLVALLTPWVLRFALFQLARWRKLDSTDAVQKLVNTRTIALVFLAFMLLHALDLCSVYFFVTAIADIPVSEGVYAALSWSAAWLIGFLVLFVPSGLGVRETSLTVLLQKIVPASIATAIGVGHRLFLTTFDLLVLIIYLGLSYLGRKTQPPTGLTPP